MTPEFEPYEEGYGAELKCPSCGFNYLHHNKVEIFECGEDAKQGVHVTVADGAATMDTDLSANPSMRRHGLKIEFWCEGCKAKPVLFVAQHKGNTVIDFVAET